MGTLLCFKVVILTFLILRMDQELSTVYRTISHKESHYFQKYSAATGETHLTANVRFAAATYLQSQRSITVKSPDSSSQARPNWTSYKYVTTHPQALFLRNPQRLQRHFPDNRQLTTESSFFFCGLDFPDSKKCEQRCPNAVDSECPNGETCYREVDCRAPPSASKTPSPTSSAGIQVNNGMSGLEKFGIIMGVVSSIVAIIGGTWKICTCLRKKSSSSQGCESIDSMSEIQEA